MTDRLNEIERKMFTGQTLSAEDGLFLLREADLLSMGQLAQEARFRLNPERSVTYAIESNPHYTNVCDTDCDFCAFDRDEAAVDAYTLDVEEAMGRIARAVKAGATTVSLQGGHNPVLPLEYHLNLVRETRKRFPDVIPHFFSASEVQALARYAGTTVRSVLEDLTDAGQCSLPGGGTETRAGRVRKVIAPVKSGAEAWLEVHLEAHRLGWRSSAAMMYGHGETAVDIVDHWNDIRAMQQHTAGFTAFVPWSYKPVESRSTPRTGSTVGASQYLRVLAASRLYLHNFPHVQSSWSREGKRVGEIALRFGADDLVGTLQAENTHAATDFVDDATPAETVHIIHDAGFSAVRRSASYEPLAAHPLRIDEERRDDDHLSSAHSAR